MCTNTFLPVELFTIKAEALLQNEPLHLSVAIATPADWLAGSSGAAREGAAGTPTGAGASSQTRLSYPLRRAWWSILPPGDIALRKIQDERGRPLAKEIAHPLEIALRRRGQFRWVDVDYHIRGLATGLGGLRFLCPLRHLMSYPSPICPLLPMGFPIAVFGKIRPPKLVLSLGKRWSFYSDLLRALASTLRPDQ
jgi:hypothetical protein